MIRERQNDGVPGLVMLVLGFLVLGGAVYLTIQNLPQLERRGPLELLIGVPVALLVFRGLFTVAPNQGIVLQLFGNYVGTSKVPGLRWANPFYSRKRISLRVRNFESGHLKVNDSDGNPIEIAAVVVWRVVETAEATFEVDDYEHYVRVQTESALRSLATSYPYDAHDDAVLSLRGNTSAVADHLQQEVQQRLAKAGVEVLEARISHLAYAPEIAAAM